MVTRIIVSIVFVLIVGCGGGGVSKVTSPMVMPPSVHVVDGDTIDLDEQRFRLAGFDAPERHQKCHDANGMEWNCGQAATDALEMLSQIRGDVSCSSSGTDSFGRIVASCSINGVDVGAHLVEMGLAVNDPRYSPDYSAEETQARDQKTGVHSGRYLAPWDWRRGERLGNAEPSILTSDNFDLDVETLLPLIEESPSADVYGAWVLHSAFFVMNQGDGYAGVSWASHFPATNPKAIDGSARWTGRMVGKDARSGNAVTGRAVIELKSFASPSVDVLLGNMSWEGVPVANGAFVSDNGSDSRLHGRFYGDRHQEVGGVFDHQHTIGAFGALRTK